MISILTDLLSDRLSRTDIDLYAYATPERPSFWIKESSCVLRLLKLVSDLDWLSSPGIKHQPESGIGRCCCGNTRRYRTVTFGTANRARVTIDVSYGERRLLLVASTLCGSLKTSYQASTQTLPPHLSVQVASNWFRSG